MQRKYLFVGVLSLLFLGSSCRSHYVMTGIQRTRLLVDQRYDAHPDPEAVAFLAPYQHDVDSIMSPVVGETAKPLSSFRPESPLSNLLSDILIWSGKKYNEHPVLAVYNMGGIRASFPQGKVTYGDVLEVAPFDNKVCFLTLSGTKLMDLFRQVAHRHGEGLSHGTQLVITRDGQLVSARLNGKEIDPNADYRVVTLDYLAGGNDGLKALGEGSRLFSPQDMENNVRFIIMDFLKEKHSQGLSVNADIEGRIIVE